MILRVILTALIFCFSVFSEEKIIDVPSQLTVEMIVANQNGLLNGTHNVRARIYNPNTKKRLWFEDFSDIQIQNGAFVLNLNSLKTINSYDFHKKGVIFVVSVDNQTVEIPLLTEFFSYRSLFAEYGSDTRFPDVLYIDRINQFLGFGTQSPKTHVDVNGAIKLGYENTSVTGAIRWNPNIPTLEVLHPSGWVDLLYNPDSFVASRWNEFNGSIQLREPNSFIGIGTSTPQYNLHVNGSGFFSGHLSAQSISANSIVVNLAKLTSTTFNATEIEISNDSKKLIWSPDILNISHGQLEGDGTYLTNVGYLTMYEKDILHSDHIINNAIQSNHIKSNSIQSDHFQIDSISTRNLSSGIFTSEFIAENSISSDNIQPYSLTFDIFIDENLSEYIPDDFFTSNLISINSVYSSHIQNQSIVSKNIISDTILTRHFSNQVIDSSNLASNSISMVNIVPNSITPPLFGNTVPITAGGTGLNSTSPHHVVILGSTAFNSSSSLSFNEQTLCLSNSSCSNAASFVINNFMDSTSARLNQSTSDDMLLQFKNSQNTAGIKLDSTGHLSFISNPYSLFMDVHASNPVISSSSVGVGPNIGQFNLGLAVTIGNSVNGVPDPGTIEYNNVSDKFGFFQGNTWTTISSTGHGIGNPTALGRNHLNLNDTYLGQVNSSTLNTSASMINSITHSIANGDNIRLNYIESSSINANNSYFNHLTSSKVFSASTIGYYIQDADINSSGAQLLNINHSFIHGNIFYAHQISNAKVFSNNSRLNQLSNSTVHADESWLNNIQHSTVKSNKSYLSMINKSSVIGTSSYIHHSTNSIIYGDLNHVLFAQNTKLIGDKNIVLNSPDSNLTGRKNMLFLSNNTRLKGHNNRNFGRQHLIKGSNNTLIGNNINLSGDHNIAFNSGTTTLDVNGHRNIVFSAPNGLHIKTGDDIIVSATQLAGGWSMVSDKNLKTNFDVVDHELMFKRLMMLPIKQWKYSFKKGVPHIGPMAQDFISLFNVGHDKRFITASDVDGVAFSSIKHLIQTVELIDLTPPPSPTISMKDIDLILNNIKKSLETIEISLLKKKESMDILLENNLEQYKLIDKHLKALSQIKYIPTKEQLYYNIFKFIGFLIFNLLIGFFGTTVYCMIKRNKEKT